MCEKLQKLARITRVNFTIPQQYPPDDDDDDYDDDDGHDRDEEEEDLAGQKLISKCCH